MRAMSNAFLNQVSVIQKNHWDLGPLELVSYDYKNSEERHTGFFWNSAYEGGLCRDAELLDSVQKIIPSLGSRSNPNIFLVPTISGGSMLDLMLRSVIPSRLKSQSRLDTSGSANLWLVPTGLHQLSSDYFRRCRETFERYIWSKLQRSGRSKYDCFSVNDPLRLLSADDGYWKARLYRVALYYYEQFEEAYNVDQDWDSLEGLRERFFEEAPDATDDFLIRRPRKGGTLWFEDDDDECEAVVEDMLDGLGVLDPVQPMLDLIHSHRVHEDFSDKYSWVREDFERSFYSKRSKVKVVLVETVDELPVWSADECYLDEGTVFRDLLACFDKRDQRLLIAVRRGFTQTEIASDLGLRGHASISRRINKIKARLKDLLD